MDRVTALGGYLKRASSFTAYPGQFDCALLTAGWVDTVRGTTFMEDWVGAYQSLPEGRKLLRAKGIKSLRDLARKELTSVGGWMAALPGDVAVIKDRHLALGIVGTGGKIHTVTEEVGLDVVPLDRAWEVFRP